MQRVLLIVRALSDILPSEHDASSAVGAEKAEFLLGLKSGSFEATVLPDSAVLSLLRVVYT